MKMNGAPTGSILGRWSCGGTADRVAGAGRLVGNQHVPAILAGAEPPVIPENGYITAGGADEATDYVRDCGLAWRQTPGAVAWLNKLFSDMPRKPRASPTAH